MWFSLWASQRGRAFREDATGVVVWDGIQEGSSEGTGCQGLTHGGTVLAVAHVRVHSLCAFRCVSSLQCLVSAHTLGMHIKEV